MCDTEDERMDAALGRMTREYALLDSRLRGLRHSLHLFNGGSPDASSYKMSEHHGQLIKDIEKAAKSLPSDLADPLAGVLIEVARVHERRIRLSHDLITPDNFPGPSRGFTITRWQPDSGAYMGHFITIEDVDEDTDDMAEVGKRVSARAGAIDQSPESSWLHRAQAGGGERGSDAGTTSEA